MESISARELLLLLESASGAILERAAEIVATLDPDRELHLSLQPAARTANTLELKYTLARTRGFSVCGLDDLVLRLKSLDGQLIQAGVAEGVGKSVIFVLDDARTSICSAFCVTHDD